VFGRLARRGHDVTLLVSGFDGAPARATADGMDVHRTGGRHTFSIAAPAYYRQNLRRLAFDLVVEDLNKVPLFTPLWAAAPVVLLVHHLFGRTAFQEASIPVAAATWLLEKPLHRFYSAVPVEAVSRSTAQDLVARGFDERQITVIENGIDLDLYRPDPGQRRFEEPTVLYLGRLRRYKRVDLIVRAFARMAAGGIAGQLIIAGSGPHAPAIERLVRELGIGDRVRLAGFVDEEEKLRLLRGAWVHVLTSPNEGWGISNLEAASCATPTVASDSPGLRDSVVHGETGLLVPHGDVDALATAIRRVLENATLREQLAAGALRFARSFGWDGTASRTEAHLEEILARRGPANSAWSRPRDAGLPVSQRESHGR
jgi:glycosyltransferase involved in cell wall biosynthesis